MTKTPGPKPERHTVIFILFVYRNLNPRLEFHHKVVILHCNLLNHPSDQGFAVLGEFPGSLCRKATMSAMRWRMPSLWATAKAVLPFLLGVHQSHRQGHHSSALRLPFSGVPAEVPEGGHRFLSQLHYCCPQGISQNLPTERG